MYHIIYSNKHAIWDKKSLKAPPSDKRRDPKILSRPTFK